MENKKQVLITGASRGIGRAISDSLLASGYAVSGIARNFGDEQASMPGFTPYSIDLASLTDLPSQLETIKENGFSPSALILNAGMGHFASLEEFSYQQIQSLMDINFTSHVFVVRSFLPGMKQTGNGNIIFIGSDAGLRGSKKGSIYCASKFALRGFSQALRAECAKSNIAVSLINPGMTKTDFYNDQGFEPGKAEENSIKLDTLTESVELILNCKTGTVIDEINISPLKHVIQFKDNKST
jgi:3-hydroxy acid dehydrogenase/malonic semialdehyde reductase